MTLDVDYYKFLMSQFAWHYYPNVEVEMRLGTRRAWPRLTAYSISHLRGVLKEAQHAILSAADKEFLVSQGLRQDYVDDLGVQSLPDFRVSDVDGRVTVRGSWWLAMFWETIVMSAFSELYHFNLDDLSVEGRRILDRKVRVLQESGLRVTDFGTRRRHSGQFHAEIVETLRDRNVLSGTSNAALASELGVPVVGTMAHEVFMVPAALLSNSPRALRAAPQVVMEQWARLWGPKNVVALTDTFGSRSFMSDLTWEQAHQWAGYRQDSGDPLRWLEVVEGRLALLTTPGKKTLVFSDGLTIEKMLTIRHAVGDRHEVRFGWGTNLTCDLGPDHPPLDLIMKVVSADGSPTVKLSDDAAKSLGDAGEVAKYREVFGA